jgi:hypothetical protein
LEPNIYAGSSPYRRDLLHLHIQMHKSFGEPDREVRGGSGDPPYIT